MKSKFPLLLATIITLLSFSLVGCAGNEESAGQMDYEETKKMVVDILKTDEGKKAIQEVMSDEKMQQNIVMDQKMVTDTIEKTLTSEKGVKFWQKVFEDPKFSEGFAKSLQKEHEKVIKGLMKDPEYQAMMIDLLKDPKIEEQMLTVVKSQHFRKHLQTVITETLESPLFKTKMQDTLLKAAEKMQKEEGQQKQGEEAGGEESNKESEGGSE
ncbi:spore germination lipoprotein GerD [Bacillus sp. FJAT-47783]|uniref:spore germination lipoprotein GerD n=1 Tax=Bacillus sp. FJAT-47783 TaxID=2922712 RepID=UPI001FAE3C23|nr:spore germination lipoprotein GerD [Bacillus sp. FJAT-47783]